MKRIAFHTLGCKLNQYETDSLASQFRQSGYEIVPFDGEADCYVINSCTVTNKADRKSRNAVNRALRNAGERLYTPTSRGSEESIGETAAASQSSTSAAVKAEPPVARVEPVASADLGSSATAAVAEGAVVLVTGCFVDSHRDTVSDSRATYFVDNKRKSQIFSIVDSHFRGEMVDPESLDPGVFDFQTPEQLFHTRTTLKVQDGCDNFCTFCIIPFVRGRATSRPVEEILTQAREAIRGGTKELVLTGVNMSRYSWESVDFASLVEKILAIPGDFRVRISSLEPDSLDDRFIELFAHPKMAPHLHLCLQSGSDRILLQMRRMYAVGGYREIVGRLRDRFPDFNLTTDIIVGFPGEDEQEFQVTLDVAEEIGFSHIHTFPYSKRSGTRAERMEGQVPEQVKQERGRRIRELSERTKRRFRSRFIGREQRLLVERVEDHDGTPVARGHGEHYLPIRLVGGAVEQNSFVQVRLIGLTDGDDPELLAELL